MQFYFQLIKLDIATINSIKMFFKRKDTTQTVGLDTTPLVEKPQKSIREQMQETLLREQAKQKGVSIEEMAKISQRIAEERRLETERLAEEQ